MNESEEAQSQSNREDPKNKPLQKVSQSSNTNIPKQNKATNLAKSEFNFKLDYDEDEADSDADHKQEKYQKAETQQQVIMFDMNQFYNLNVGNDVKELLQFMNK